MEGRWASRIYPLLPSIHGAPNFTSVKLAASNLIVYSLIVIWGRFMTREMNRAISISGSTSTVRGGREDIRHVVNSVYDIVNNDKWNVLSSYSKRLNAKCSQREKNIHNRLSPYTHLPLFTARTLACCQSMSRLSILITHFGIFVQSTRSPRLLHAHQHTHTLRQQHVHVKLLGKPESTPMQTTTFSLRLDQIIHIAAKFSVIVQMCA